MFGWLFGGSKKKTVTKPPLSENKSPHAKSQRPQGVKPPMLAKPNGVAAEKPAQKSLPKFDPQITQPLVKVTSITDVTQVPSFSKITTVLDGDHAINEISQSDLACLEIDENRYILLVTKSAFRTNQHHGLRSRILRSGGIIESDLEIEPGTLRVLYSNYIAKTAENEENKKFSSENPELNGKVERMVRDAVKKRSTDIHICSRTDSADKTGVVLLRIDGIMRVWDKFPAEDLNDIVGYMYTKMASEGSRSSPSYNNRASQSCTVLVSVDGMTVRIRYQTIKVNGGFDAVLRLLVLNKDDKPVTLQMLGYADSQCHSLDIASRKTVGVIIIAGVTGSGKSTTLKTLMTMSPRRHLIKAYSVEDPVEYKIYKVSQINVQRSSDNKDAGTVNPFLEPMKTIMRADPDIIMAGEVRDIDSCEMLQTMVQSGHQVLTTVHASSAIEILDRLSSKQMGLSRHTMSSKNFISALVYQKLIPKLCEHCKIPAKQVVPAERLQLLTSKFKLNEAAIFAAKEDQKEHDKCPHCEGLGVKGMTVAAEIIAPDIEFLKLIRDGKDIDAEELWRGSRTSKFDEPDMTGKTAFEHGLYKVSQGLVDPRHLEDSFDPLESYRIVEMRTNETSRIVSQE